MMNRKQTLVGHCVVGGFAPEIRRPAQKPALPAIYERAQCLINILINFSNRFILMASGRKFILSILA
jgi:hypothetical protein